MKKLDIVTALTAIVLSLAATNIVALNPRVSSPESVRLTKYGLTATRDDGMTVESTGKPGGASALGGYVSDGGSPGYIIGRSWKDDQNHLNPGRMIGWRNTPQMHFIYTNQVCGGLYNPDVCSRWIHYNMFDPTTSPGGVFIAGPNGLAFQDNPIFEGGMYANLDVDENGRVIGVAEALNSAAGSGAVRYTKLWWDISSPGWGTFLADDIPDQNTGSGLSINKHYPVVNYQEYGGQYVTHVVALNGIAPGDPNDKIVTYWRKVNSASGIGGVWTSMQVADGPWSNTYSMAVSRDATGKAAIAWCQERNPADDVGAALWLITSTDAGANWSAPMDVVAWTEGVPSWQPWNECSILYDTENFLHIVYNAKRYDGTSMGDIDPARIYHWSDRVAGEVAGGTTSLIQAFDFNGLEGMCGRFGHNLLIVGMPVISECNDRLYTIWMQAGDPDIGDSTDCPGESVGIAFAYNSDIHMSVSSSLDGLLWDARRNLTNSKNPGCDGTDGNPCDHDTWGTMTRYGMDTRVSVIGNTYWSSAPEAFDVRGALAPTYPDTGFFLDVQFVDDLLPENAMFLGNEFWTYNPIKWFRLPCVDPVIESSILISKAPFIHPAHWVKSGSEQALDIVIENVGNAELNVTGISANVLAGTNWLQINTASLTIPPAGTDVASFTLNPGGIIDPAPPSAEGIEAWIYFDSDDPNTPRDSFYINTVITDTVITVSHGVVTTGLGVSLGALNNGNAANWPNTGGYMQFYQPDGIDMDCDLQEVYLYELSPIVMYDAGTYFWNTYYDFSDPDPNTNLLPVPGGRESESCSSGGMNQYITGEFVTADSALGMVKTWAAPEDNVSFVVEKWEIFSYDGNPHTGVQLGEWADCDVPSDTSVNSTGTVVQANDYIYVSGQETDGDQDCIQNDGRFYTTGLLGYYTSDEYTADPGVNHTGLAGAYVTQVADLMDENFVFDPDSVWSHLTRNEFNANNARWDDQRTLLSFGSVDITPGDTLIIWVLHGTLINSDESGVADQVLAAKEWYATHRDDVGVCGCCGIFTGGLSGNADCDELGKLNLADITRLIDRVYISKAPLCCEENGNVDGDSQGKLNLADITRLIDVVYISKNPGASCL